MTTTNTTETITTYYLAPEGRTDRDLAGEARLNQFATLAEAQAAGASLAETLGGSWDIIEETEGRKGRTVVATMRAVGSAS
jgi:hypothetical protein